MPLSKSNKSIVIVKRSAVMLGLSLALNAVRPLMDSIIRIIICVWLSKRSSQANSLKDNVKLNFKQRRPERWKKPLRLKPMLMNINKRRSPKKQIKTKLQSVKKIMRRKRLVKKMLSSLESFWKMVVSSRDSQRLLWLFSKVKTLDSLKLGSCRRKLVRFSGFQRIMNQMRVILMMMSSG